MSRKKNVIAPEAQTMDLIVQKKEENLTTVGQIFSALGILGTEYDSFLFIETAKNLKGLHEKSAVAFGAVLLSIKENEQHGCYYKALEQIKIHPKKANRYIHIAKHYGKSDILSDLTPAKYDVLDALTDEELEKLEAGEEVKGLTLDAIDKMPATELRKRLRTAEEKVTRTENVYKEKVRQKDEQIKKLEMENNEWRSLSDEEIAAKKIVPQLKVLQNELFLNIQCTIDNLRKAIKNVDDATRLKGVTFSQLEEWRDKDYENLATINDLFENLDDALVNIHVGRGDGE